MWLYGCVAVWLMCLCGYVAICICGHVVQQSVVCFLNGLETQAKLKQQSACQESVYEKLLDLKRSRLFNHLHNSTHDELEAILLKPISIIRRRVLSPRCLGFDFLSRSPGWVHNRRPLAKGNLLAVGCHSPRDPSKTSLRLCVFSIVQNSVLRVGRLQKLRNQST